MKTTTIVYSCDNCGTTDDIHITSGSFHQCKSCQDKSVHECELGCELEIARIRSHIREGDTVRVVVGTIHINKTGIVIGESEQEGKKGLLSWEVELEDGYYIDVTSFHLDVLR